MTEDEFNKLELRKMAIALAIDYASTRPDLTLTEIITKVSPEILDYLEQDFEDDRYDIEFEPDFAMDAGNKDGIHIDANIIDLFASKKKKTVMKDDEDGCEK